jgi:hypothetical protein
MTYHIVRRTKRDDGPTSAFVLPDTDEEKFEDADVMAEIMATEHANRIMTDAPTSTDAGVYQLMTSNGSVVEYLVRETGVSSN